MCLPTRSFHGHRSPLSWEPSQTECAARSGRKFCPHSKHVHQKHRPQERSRDRPDFCSTLLLVFPIVPWRLGQTSHTRFHQLPVIVGFLKSSPPQTPPAAVSELPQIPVSATGSMFACLSLFPGTTSRLAYHFPAALLFFLPIL